MEAIDKSKKMGFQLWEKARLYEDRRQSGFRRLRRFKLLTRILLFWRFQKIREIIRQRGFVRAHMVMMALGVIKKARLMERAARERAEREKK